MTLIDTETAAHALGVTDRTIRRWVRDGKLVNHGTARRIKVDLDEVMRVSDARERDVR